MRYLFINTVIFLLLSNNLTLAYWSHGSISDNTRLNHHQNKKWSLSLIINDHLIYPADLYCPAGFTITMNILNLSGKDVVFESKKPFFKLPVQSNTYKSFDFGKLQTAQYPFIITSTSGKNKLVDKHENNSSSMTCKIISSQWPGEEFVYRVTLLCRGTNLYPEELWIPSGKASELFVAADQQAPNLKLNVGPHTIIITPGQVTMTAFMQPKSGCYELRINNKTKGKLYIR